VGIGFEKPGKLGKKFCRVFFYGIILPARFTKEVKTYNRNGKERMASVA
jgi:hypothetical protein